MASIFSVIGNAIGNFFKKEIPVVENAFTSATTVVNVLKTFLGSATGQTVEAIAVALLPGVAPAVISAVNEFFVGFGLVSSELSKPATEIAADGLNAIANLTDKNKTLALSNLATVIGDAASNANGGNSSLQQAIVAVPLVYNPTLLDSVGVATTSTPVITQAQLTVAPAPDENA